MICKEKELNRNQNSTRKRLPSGTSPRRHVTAICLHDSEINVALIYSPLSLYLLLRVYTNRPPAFAWTGGCKGSNVTSKLAAHVVPSYEKLVVNRGEPSCFAVGANITVTVRSLVASFLRERSSCSLLFSARCLFFDFGDSCNCTFVHITIFFPYRQTRVHTRVFGA